MPVLRCLLIVFLARLATSQTYSKVSVLRIEQRVEDALRHVQRILSSTRQPRYPADVAHRYDDKYMLAEIATKAAVSGILNLIDALVPRWWASNQEKLLQWAAVDRVILRFSACGRCSFERTELRDRDSDTKVVSDNGWVTSTAKTVTTTQEHFWIYKASWDFVVFPGVKESDQLELLKHSGQYRIKTRTAKDVPPAPPHKELQCASPLDVDLTWLLARLKTRELAFTINRTAATCRTPRRNRDMEEAFAFFEEFSSWAKSVTRYFLEDLFAIQQRHGFDVAAIAKSDEFSPVLGLYALESVEEDGGSAMTLMGDFRVILQEHHRRLGARLAKLAAMFPSGTSPADGLVTAVPARAAAALLEGESLGRDHRSIVSAIEGMLRKQLVAAVGREVASADFAEFADFHGQRLFRRRHAPSRLSRAVRRPGRSPEGLVSLEVVAGGSSKMATPLIAFSAHHPPKSLRVALSASTDVELHADRFLHACVLHRFSTDPPQELQLTARARQFSNFVLLVGHLASADRFEPTAALIVKDRDDLIMPLLQETLPTPKEFRDAIESLSPEQQRFAKAFREMQLSSTVFGICVVQIKPQMEVLLNLPKDSLTKEIQLTQDLLELFIKYQIPPDLLSFDGDTEASGKAKLDVVRSHVASLWSIINATQQRELEEARHQAEKSDLQDRECKTRLGSSLSVLDFVRLGSSLALRRFARLGSDIQAFSFNAESSSSLAAGTGESVRPEHGLKRRPTKPDRPPEPPSRTDAGEAALDGSSSVPDTSSETSADMSDYTAVPARLDARLLAYDTEAALRPTKLQLGPTWSKTEQAGLLSPLRDRRLGPTEQRGHRTAAFDLLDALSRSGALPVQHSELHAVVAATHGFDQTLVETVVTGNSNPIESFERSLLLVASTVSGLPAAQLVAEEHLERLRGSSPGLLDSGAGAEEETLHE